MKLKYRVLPVRPRQLFRSYPKRTKAPGFNGMYSTDNIKHVKVGHSHLEERKSVKSGSKFNSTIIKPSTTGSVPVVRIFSVISVNEDVKKEN